uniref:Nidogen n=1 Tax=Clastoptera arizonana TaxID=38151 RepID=A0A1B6D9X9_9HEMI
MRLEVLCAIACLVGPAWANGFYGYGPASDASLPRQNDVSSPEIPLTVPIVLYGEEFNSIFVNENGLLSFLTDIPQFISVQIPLHYPAIAPLYSNVDIGGRGNVFYRETQDPELLREATAKVQRYYPNLATPFTAQSIFIATWLEVGYFNEKSDKKNTFQVAIVTDGTESFVEFHYKDIQWIQAEAQTAGLPDARAQAGFMSTEINLFYTLPGSGTDRVENLNRWSNTDVPGFWMFRIGAIRDFGNVEPPQILESENTIDSTCNSHSTSCHSKADCIDHVEGFCCKCLTGYFGNGRACLQEDIPLRVNGKVSFDINGIKESEIVIQSYVITTDGRSYTALSKVPSVIGRDMQLINIISNIIGWLFAKPIGEALNGYQVTGGVFNQSADISFSKTKDRIEVHQQFQGLDVFDQLKLEAQIRGTIPPLPHNIKLSIPQFVQQFRKLSPGVLKAQGTVKITEESTEEELVVMTIDQTIHYTEWCTASPIITAPLRMKSARNFISYEDTESILRFASTNKISLLSENDDPCIAGQITCVNNSVCIPEGDNFRCVCNRGFETVYGEDGSNDYGCVDINECTTGSHRCDEAALCINEIGSFGCECRQGFTGDGFTCRRETQGCEELSCDKASECQETPEGAKCVCIQGFISNGEICVPNIEDDCISCSPFAWCNHTDDGHIKCTCYPGYSGDGNNCQPLQQYNTYAKTCMNNHCWCPPGLREYGDICVQDKAAPEHEGEVSCSEVNMCSPYGSCVEVETQRYECQCNPGYEGDGIDCQETQQSCLDGRDLCHQNAACILDDRSDRYICMCNKGFIGNGINCRSQDKCNEDSDCGAHASCSYSEITEVKECICEVNYVQDYGACIHQNCLECHPDAECVQDPETEVVCRCNPGFIGDGVTRCESEPETCGTADICHNNAQCIYDNESGYKCACDVGFEGNGLHCTPEKKTCYNTPSLCHEQANCVRIQDSFECECKEGYAGNGAVCKEIRQQKGGFLLVSKGIAIIQVPFQTSSSNPGRPIHLTYDQIAIGLTIDCGEGRVYWSDIGSKTIKSSLYDGKDSVDFMNSDSGIDSPEGLAVDWVNRKLYWTDSVSDTINTASLDSGERQEIVSNGLVNPRGIAVHPGRRKVFWSDWDRRAPKLEWSWLDGSGRTVLIQDHSVQLPNSLAIDFDQNELCWTDAGTKNIDCIGIDSGIRRTVVSNCSYPFGLAITFEKYYWTDWITQKVESAWKHTGASAGSLLVPPSGAGKLYGIAAVNDNCPRY